MRFVKLVDKIDSFFRILIIIAFIAALAVVGASIFVRNVLSHSFPWAEEAAKYLTIFVVFCTAGVASRNNGLTRLTFIIDILPLRETGKKVVEWMVGVVSMAFWVLVGYSAYRLILMVQASGQVSAAMQIPQWIPMVSMVVGSVLLILNTLAYLVSNGQENSAIERSEAE